MPKDTQAAQPFNEIRRLLLHQREAGMKKVRADRSLLQLRSGLGETLLHWMVVENQLPTVEALIQAGAEVDTVNHFGSTPLQEAAQCGHTEMCLLMLAHGADVMQKNDAGESVLSVVVHLKRHVKLVSALLDRIPAEVPLSGLLGDDAVMELSGRDDPVALLFQQRGLPEVEWP